MIATDLPKAWLVMPSVDTLDRDMSGLGGGVRPFLEPLFDRFRDDAFAIALASGIGGVAVLLLLVYIGHVCLVRSRLGKWCDIVEKNKPADFMVRLKGMSDFLVHAWIKFEQTLVKPDPDLEHAPHRQLTSDPTQVFLSTVRPQVFFNAHDVLPGLRLYRILPGLFVGVGLLLTFVGLVSALHFATKEIGLSASSEPQGALLGLLESAKFKFYASVAGLGSSLLFVVLLRAGDRIVDIGFDRFSRALERKIQIVTTEDLTRQLVFLGRQQLNEINRLNTDIAVAIGKQVSDVLDSKLSEHVGAKLTDLGNKLDKFAHSLSGMNADAMQNLVTQFTSQLQSTTKEQFEELTGMLREVTNSLATAKGNIDGAGTSLAEKLAGSTNAIDGAAQNLAGSVDGLKRTLDESADRFKLIQDSLDETGRSLNGLIGNLGALSNDITHASASLHQATAPLTQVAERLSPIGESLAQTSDKIDSSLVSLRRAADSLRETAATAHTTWTRYSQRFSEVDESLARMHEKLTQATEDLAKQFRDYVTGMDRSLASCVNNLDGFQLRLAEILDEIKDVLTELKDVHKSSASPA